MLVFINIQGLALFPTGKFCSRLLAVQFTRAKAPLMPYMFLLIMIKYSHQGEKLLAMLPSYDRKLVLKRSYMLVFSE